MVSVDPTTCSDNASISPPQAHAPTNVETSAESRVATPHQFSAGLSHILIRGTNVTNLAPQIPELSAADVIRIAPSAVSPYRTSVDSADRPGASMAPISERQQGNYLQTLRVATPYRPLISLRLLQGRAVETFYLRGVAFLKSFTLWDIVHAEQWRRCVRRPDLASFYAVWGRCVLSSEIIRLPGRRSGEFYTDLVPETPSPHACPRAELFSSICLFR